MKGLKLLEKPTTLLIMTFLEGRTSRNFLVDYFSE